MIPKRIDALWIKALATLYLCFPYRLNDGQLLLNLDDMEKLTKKDIQEITEIFTNMLAGILIWEILKFLFYLLLLP